VATTDEYFAARDQRDGAKAELEAIAQRLSDLASTLHDPRGVRLNEKTAYKGPPPNHRIVDRDDLVPWDRLEAAVRAFTRADDAFRRIDADLTLDQRRQLRR
jgi:hypothetical protein